MSEYKDKVIYDGEVCGLPPEPRAAGARPATDDGTNCRAVRDANVPKIPCAFSN